MIQGCELVPVNVETNMITIVVTGVRNSSIFQ